MKKLTVIFLLGIMTTANAGDIPRVLLFMRNAQSSGDLEYMLKKEVLVMKNTLEKSGYEVTIATLDGSPFTAGPITVEADIKLSEANIADYAGLILPCLAVPSYPEPEVSPEIIALVQETMSAGKPVAAQTGSLWTLARAGVLKGKNYAYAFEEKNPHFDGATFAGTGVVTDGLVITSGICPYMELKAQVKDGTEEVSLALAEAMHGDHN